jgi:hypothetical protein
MSRVGNVYMWKTCFAVVTAELGPTRKPGSTLGPEAAADSRGRWLSDLQVYTLAVFHDSGGCTWPVERLEDTLIKWEQDGRLLTP